MAIVAGDFETFYSQDYSLSKMSEVEYILDPRFQTIMLTLKVDRAPTEVLIGHKAVAHRLSQLDWSRIGWVSHNTRFDGSILAWHYGCVPKLYLDTLSMARATTHWLLGRSGLKYLSDYLGLPPKGDEIVRALGKRLEDFAPAELQAYADYSVRDNENCRDIFDRLRPLFSDDELQLIDVILRMHILPQVRLNPDMLAQNLAQVRAEKAAAMQRVSQIDKSVFSSNQKFAALLETYGIEVPKKISQTTGLETFALAKNDRAFKELCMDDTLPMEVQAILAARVSAKSTIEETRSDNLLRLSRLQWTPERLPDVDVETWDAAVNHGLVPSRGTGWAPVPLKYYGARPGRLSGDGGTNWQNFKRGSMIRESIEAPPGYRIVHRDSSQIEARLVATLAGCTMLIQAFAQGRDVYSEFASSVYRRPVTKADKGDRFVGKTSILGLGYGCGPPKFRHMLYIGNGGMSMSIEEPEARRIVYHYRREYPEIPKFWGVCDALIAQIGESSGHRGFRSVVKDYEARRRLETMPVKAGFDALWLPNGMCISYPNIRYDRLPDGTQGFVYDGPYGETKKLYGAKCVQNICEGLGRIIVMSIAVRMYRLTGRHPFLTAHDSLSYCVPETEAQWWDAELDRQFAIVPDFLPGLPLASEGGWGVNLAAAERAENR